MFGRNEDISMAKQSNPTVSNQINMIGEGTVLEGTLNADGDIRISGRVVGKLDIKGKIIVAQEGDIEGEVKAMNLDVGGRIRGDVHVEERVVLKSSARVEGNIIASRLVIEEGAVFNGECKMGSRTISSDTMMSDREIGKVREIRGASEQGDGF